ncbi:MAG: O-antigen polymerase [Rhodospirillales bacterium]|nr:O-antigen polymerase [Rhodospirillales bacterium]
MSGLLARARSVPAAHASAAIATIDQAGFAPVQETVPSRPERLFLGFAFLVLQGAFVGMAGTQEAADASQADGGDIRHMVAFALVLIGTAIFARKHWRGMTALAGASLPYFILPAMILASTLWSVEPSLTLKRAVLTTGICAFDLYVAISIGLDRLLRMLSTTILISALASIVVAIAVPTIGREIVAGLTGDWRGVFPQKNALGHVMSVGVFVELAMMIRARRWLPGACIRTVLLIALVAMAHSASSLLSVTIALMITALYAAFRRGLTSALVCALAVAALLILIVGTVGGDPAAVFDVLDRDPSLTGRTDLWKYVLDAIRERPVSGWGYMAFWTPDGRNATYIQHQIGWPAPNAHDGYLELALSLGAIGLAGLAATALWTARRIIVALLQKHDLGALLLIASTQLLIANLTESFIISASVFGWNVFSILALKTGVLAPAMPKGTGSAALSLLDRAKARPAATVAMERP